MRKSKSRRGLSIQFSIFKNPNFPYTFNNKILSSNGYTQIICIPIYREQRKQNRNTVPKVIRTVFSLPVRLKLTSTVSCMCMESVKGWKFTVHCATILWQSKRSNITTVRNCTKPDTGHICNKNHIQFNQKIIVQRTCNMLVVVVGSTKELMQCCFFFWTNERMHLNNQLENWWIIQTLACLLR